MAPRFKEKVQIQPIQTGSGAAQGMLSLADRLESFKSLGGATLDAGVKAETGRAIKRGVKSAGKVPLEKKDGITQKPKVKEETFFGGTEVAAHNKALGAAYLASLDNDNREAISGIFQENKSNLIGFNESVAGYTKGVLQGVDPAVRLQVKADLDKTASLTRTKVHANEIKKQEGIAKSELEQNVLSATNASLADSRNGDIELSAENMVKAFQTIDAGVKAGYITPADAATHKREIEKGASEQAIFREVDILADTSIPAAYEKIDKMEDKVPRGWSPDEWKGVVVEAQQNVNRRSARLNKEHAKISKELLLQQSIDRGAQFMNPDIPADPAKGSQDKKDVNNAYDVVSQGWNALPPLEQFDKNIEFIKNTGIMPDGIIRGVNASMRSGTPDQIAVMSKLVETIAADPNAANILRDIPTESRAISKQISDSVESGIELETAIEIARKNTYGLTESQKDDIKLQVRELRTELPSFLEDMVDKEFDPSIIPFFGEEPDVSTALQADFNLSFEKYMTLTDGDATQSQKLAFDSLKNVWGATKIGGDNRFMKYSPEVFYSVPGVGNDWMEDQYDKDISGLGVKSKDTVIAVDFDVANSGQPSWPVLFTDKKGALQPLLSDGVPVRWQPDFKGTREYMELRAKPAEETLKAKKLRKEMIRIGNITSPEGV